MQGEQKAFSTWPGVSLTDEGLNEVGNMIDQLSVKLAAIERILRQESERPPPPSPDEDPPRDSLH